MPSEEEGRDWMMRLQAKESLGAIRNWERQERGFPLKASERAGPSQHLSFGLVASRAVRQHISVV